jgi:hypothetical protein
MTYLGIDVRGEPSGHTESMDESFNTFGRHGVFRVESGDTSLHVQGREKRRRTVSGLPVRLAAVDSGYMTYTSEENEFRAVGLGLVFRDKLVGVRIGKVESWACSLFVSLGTLASTWCRLTQ